MPLVKGGTPPLAFQVKFILFLRFHVQFRDPVIARACLGPGQQFFPKRRAAQAPAAPDALVGFAVLRRTPPLQLMLQLRPPATLLSGRPSSVCQ